MNILNMIPSVYKSRRMGIRIFIVSALILTMLSGFFIIHVYANDQSPNEPLVLVEQNYLVTDVAAGDTLWSLANRYVPEGESVRSYMKKIREVNQLTGSLLREGQILYIPQ
ncbi:LysM peptidoglycan-binding domain-containing protein [Paenibacillus senegalensis]|uniref:LysM peptidoglycan-binding domain-containing protein n=1 Tax=Paenibacillus senegalensis TaxID=1465766 RepID=UPI00028A2EC0|nr:LysM peptidoglycan-binding domain-containing protein [Paenibacillus senegalensis]